MANHKEYVEAYLESTNRLYTDACNQWMNSKLNHPLYSQLSNSRTTPQDKLLLETIYKDIEPLRQISLDLRILYQQAYEDFVLYT